MKDYPLSGNECGSPNHIVLIISFLFVVLFTQFILDISNGALYPVKQIEIISVTLTQSLLCTPTYTTLVCD